MTCPRLSASASSAVVRDTAQEETLAAFKTVILGWLTRRARRVVRGGLDRSKIVPNVRHVLAELKIELRPGLVEATTTNNDRQEIGGIIVGGLQSDCSCRSSFRSLLWSVVADVRGQTLVEFRRRDTDAVYYLQVRTVF